MSNPMSNPIRKPLALTISALLSMPVFANNAEISSQTPNTLSDIERVVVTGRASGNARTKSEISYSMTDISANEIRDFAPLSAADLLQSVPGFFIESAGGNASSAVKARGIPSDNSIGWYEDGLPVVHDPRLGYQAGDQYFRLDETISHVEVVRGGPASIFGANAPGGIVNYMTRKGDDEGTIIKLSGSDYGTRRVDFFQGSELGNDWALAVGGFYLSEDGLRDTEFKANQGGQFRATLSKNWHDGRFDVGVKYLNDRNSFYLGVPFTKDADGNLHEINGFDPLKDTHRGLANSRQIFRTPNGVQDDLYDGKRGISTDMVALTLNFEQELANGWQFTAKGRYRDSGMTRDNIWLDAIFDGSDVLNMFGAAVPPGIDLELRYNDGSSFTDQSNGNGLAAMGRAQHVASNVEEFVSDFQFSNSFDTAFGTHDVAFGLYMADLRGDFFRVWNDVILDVKGNADFLNVVAVDGAGNELLSMTENGVYNYGGQYVNEDYDNTHIALYGSDEWQITEQVRLDLGMRYETQTRNVRQQERISLDLSDEHMAASNVLWGGSNWNTFQQDSDGLGWTAGLNYQFNRNQGLFARYTSAFQLPSTADGNDDTPIQYTDQAEVGYKLNSNDFSLYATIFHTNFKDVPFSSWAQLPDGSFDPDPIEDSYNAETLGLELEATWIPTDWFDIKLITTLQDQQYKGWTYTDENGIEHDFDGNQMRRAPNTMARLVPAITLMNGDMRINLDGQYFGTRYEDAANLVELDDYFLLNANAFYHFSENLTLSASLYNLTNTLALSEGNPRGGTAVGNPDLEYFLGRPLFGRNVRFSLMYQF
ncbi:TonB-dependent receptor [Ferrimonas pelagia]|uniref:TonB-dependent receptor n=1 Tax=Ferrimonas pelagia TaxID=1177826 RepID=A0ABP9FDV5_9GAMM